MPAARHISRSPCIALAVIATMRGRLRRRPARADPARRLEAVHLGHLHVHQHDVVGLALAPTRSPRCRSTRGRRGSPSAAAGAARASGSPTLSSASRMRSGWRAAIVGVDAAAWPAPARPWARASCASSADQRVEQLRLAHRLGEVGGEQPLGVAGLAPAERAEQHERQRRRALRGCAAPASTPSISGMCMSRIARSKRSPASSQRSASRRRLGGARHHAPLARSAASSTRRLVALSSTTSTRLPCSSGCAPTKSRRRVRRQLGERRLDREEERRALARPVALGPHASAHQLGEALADREAEAGAAVLARRRRVGLRERLEQPAHALGATGRCRCRARRRSSSTLAGRQRACASPSARPRRAR